MPKSRHRKDQKKKSKARTQQVKSKQLAFQKKMQQEWENKIEELKNKETDIVESNPKKAIKAGEVDFEEIKS
jgi:hypothetical protein